MTVPVVDRNSICRDAGRRRLLQGASGLALGAALPAWAGQAVPVDFQMAYFETYSPLSFMEHGSLHGILVEVLDAVLTQRMGLHCKHEGFPWPRAQRMVEQGERDAICTIATPERLAYSEAVAEPVVSAPNCIFARADNPRIETFARARNLSELLAMKPTIVTYSANGWAKAKLKEFDLISGGDFNSAVKMLIARRADMMVENVLVMSYILARTEGGEAVKMLSANRMDQADFQLLISKKSPHLERRAEISRALAQYKATPAYAEVFKRYGAPVIA
jgi:polar amino acid transport system substrate-binding protein